MRVDHHNQEGDASGGDVTVTVPSRLIDCDSAEGFVDEMERGVLTAYRGNAAINRHAAHMQGSGTRRLQYEGVYC